MGTRSFIAKENKDGSFKGIYCHWDGYVEHNGQLLFEHYTKPAKINALIRLGDISALAPEIGEKHPFDFSKTMLVDGVRQDNPEYDPAWAKMVLAYGRDRGEEGTEPKTFATEQELISWAEGSGGEYIYIWRNGQWYVSARYKENRSFYRLKDILESGWDEDE